MLVGPLTPDTRGSSEVNKQRIQLTRALVVVAALGMAGAACSTEKIGQSIAENAIENACENEGTECNVDLDGDSIQFETEDGTMTIDENGNAQIVGADGQVVNVDADDNGDMTVTDASGSVVVEQDGDTMTISGEDGDATFSSGGDLPAEFPSDIELPEGSTVSGSSVMGDPASGGMVIVTVTVPGDLESVSEAAVAGIAAAGYTETARTQTAEGGYYAFERDAMVVNLITALDGTAGTVALSYSVGGA